MKEEKKGVLKMMKLKNPEWDENEVIESVTRYLKVVEPCTGGIHLVPYRLVEIELNKGLYITILYEEYNINEYSNNECNINLWRVTKESIIDKFEDMKLEKFDDNKEYNIWPSDVEYLEQSEEYYYVVDLEIDTINTPFEGLEEIEG